MRHTFGILSIATRHPIIFATMNSSTEKPPMTRTQWIAECALALMEWGEFCKADALEHAINEFLRRCHEEPFTASLRWPVHLWPHPFDAAIEAMYEWHDSAAPPNIHKGSTKENK